MGQERYLKGVALRRKTCYRWSEDWSHDHCEFCGVTLVPPDDPAGTVRTGRKATLVARDEFPDDYHRNGDDCFGDFEQTFRWRVVD